MKSKLLSNIEERREWALGDEAMAGLKSFAEAEKLKAAHLTGIGAFARAEVTWFDFKNKKYCPIEINEQVEVLSLLGDIAEADGKPSVHVHLCVGKRDGTAHGGHLQQAIVRPTLEVIVVEAPAHLRKSFRPEVGLALIDLQK
jgi:hypothetical protein